MTGKINYDKYKKVQIFVMFESLENYCKGYRLQKSPPKKISGFLHKKVFPHNNSPKKLEDNSLMNLEELSMENNMFVGYNVTNCS